MFSEDTQLLKDKIHQAISYAGKESSVSVFEAVAVLEWLKADLINKFNNTCPRCNQPQVCNHCGKIL